MVINYWHCSIFRGKQIYEEASIQRYFNLPAFTHQTKGLNYCVFPYTRLIQDQCGLKFVANKLLKFAGKQQALGEACTSSISNKCRDV